MRHGSLFSGIGGFDLAAEWMGWQNIFHCEWNDFGKQVLKYYWPESISYHDITKTDFTIHREQIDILTGGFPCQPYSEAGKRLGKEDDRHLWPEMLRAIREIAPTWVVGENVRGLVNWNGGLVFDEVQFDLEAEGYEVQSFLLPAAGVNAPHRRDRVWFVGYKKKLDGNTESNGNTTLGEVSAKRPRHTESADSLGVRGTVQGNAPDTGSIGCNNWGDNREERHIQRNINGDASQSESEWNGWKRGIGEIGEIGNATDTDHQGLQGGEVNGSDGQLRQESHELTTRFVQPTWDNFPTQSPICGRDDGLPSELDRITFSKWRNESIKAYGNAIVPQVALQIFKAISEYNFLTNKTEEQ